MAPHSFVLLGSLLARAISQTPAFQFPKIKFVGIVTKGDPNAPKLLVQNGPEDAQNLRRRLIKHCNAGPASENKSNASFRWEPHIRESYEAANVIFEELARDQSSSMSSAPRQIVLSFPSLSQPNDLGQLRTILQSYKCKKLLGLEDVSAELYPSSPAPYIRIIFSSFEIENDATRSNQHDQQASGSAANAMEDWVNKFLGKYALCPYTSSVSRAAVGLSSVGIPVGGVHIRIVSTGKGHQNQNVQKRSYNVRRATKLVNSFWSEVVSLMQSPQEEWATSLVVFPEYDADFESFVEVCDSVVEPTVTSTRATAIIGRAWFHPRYDADAVGHSEVIPGHAVPHRMVEGFMKSIHSPGGKDDLGLIDYDELTKANNRVRQTPHATINILRRSQLTAAEEYERGLGDRRPRANSIYVRNARRLSEAIQGAKQ